MRHVLVTGACGGLGSRVTELLASGGETVFAADIDRRSLRGIARAGVVPIRMEVGSGRDVDVALKKVESLTDGLDGLACCAGIFAAGPLVEVDEVEMRRILEVNLMGAFRVVRAFFPLVSRRGGTIVLVGSESTRCAMPFNGPYTVSKSALESYADVLRRELMFLGVHVSIVQPGAFRTPLLRGAEEKMHKAEGGTMFPKQLVLVRRMLSREWSKGREPEEVARLVVRALHSRRPRPRYRIGNDPLRTLLGALPAGWTDRLIRRFV